MPRYGAWPAKINGSWVVNNLDSLEPSSNVELLTRRASGETHPTFSSVISAENSCNFTSRDVRDVLANASPVNAAKGLTLTAFLAQYRRKGVASGTDSHVTLTSTSGFLFVTDFGAEQDSPEGADINFRAVLLASGSNKPVVASSSQVLQEVPAVNAVFKLGPCSFEAVPLQIRRSRLNTGFGVVTKRHSGNVHADEATIDTENFNLEIDTDDITTAVQVATNYGEGAPVTNGTSVYFRRVGFPGSAPEHIAVHVTEGVYTVPSIPVQGEADASLKIQVQCTARPSILLNQSIPANLL
jgi:hypothetical protein